MSLLTWILTTIGATVAGVAGRYTQAWFAKHINQMKKERALARIQQEPYYRVGNVISAAICPSSGVTVVENYYIADMDVGRVLLKQVDGEHVLPMTGMEFEALQVIINPNQTIVP